MSGDMPLARLTGRVVNSQTQQPVADAEVVARESATRHIYSTARTDTNGQYTLSVPVSTPVQVTAQSDTLFYDSYTVVVPETAKNETVERTEPIALSRSCFLRVNFPTSEWGNPYGTTLDSNGMETDRAWQTELDELAENVTSAASTVRKIVLVGHTDDVDTDESNLVLGSQRVNFVIDKLVERGVPRTILEGRSEGEIKLLERRKGESIETWRKRCRRVELMKVSS
jgi:outer membrane protein OmpA-like peptidoglycan-associated protein